MLDVRPHHSTRIDRAREEGPCGIYASAQGGRRAGDGSNRVSAMTRPSRGHGSNNTSGTHHSRLALRSEILAGTVKVLVLVMILLQGCAFLSEVERPAATPPPTYERRCGPVTPMEPLDADPQVVPDD